MFGQEQLGIWSRIEGGERPGSRLWLDGGEVQNLEADISATSPLSQASKTWEEENNH